MVDETDIAAETKILCEIQSDFTAADEHRFVEKNKRFWSLGKHYFKVEYSVKVIIGPADIRFELCTSHVPRKRQGS
jgi:hypothetical protein